MSKIYTRFHTKNRGKTLPFGAAHTYTSYIGEYPPPLDFDSPYRLA